MLCRVFELDWFWLFYFYFIFPKRFDFEEIEKRRKIQEKLLHHQTIKSERNVVDAGYIYVVGVVLVGGGWKRNKNLSVL